MALCRNSTEVALSAHVSRALFAQVSSLTSLAIPNDAFEGADKVCEYRVDVVEASQNRNDGGTRVGIFLGENTREENAECLVGLIC
jgi:hypothetical protein